MDTATVSERPILITLEQAAQRLAISRRTLERLIAAGEFPSRSSLVARRVSPSTMSIFRLDLPELLHDAADSG